MFTLCQLLGFAHPEHLLGALTARQLDDWLAWMRKVQPFPGRHDPYWAMLLAMTHNAWCDDRDAMRAEEFLLYHDRYEDEELTADDLRARLGLRG